MDAFENVHNTYDLTKLIRSMKHGVATKTPTIFKEILKGTSCTVKNFEQQNGKLVIQIDDNTHLEIPNRGIKCFSKRAILRIGMLLRDSKIAQEVRTQLLKEYISEKAKQVCKRRLYVA